MIDLKIIESIPEHLLGDFEKYKDECSQVVFLIENGIITLNNYKDLFSKQIKTIKKSNKELVEMIKVKDSINSVKYLIPTDEIVNKGSKYEGYLCLIKGLKSYSGDKDFIVKEIKENKK